MGSDGERKEGPLCMFIALSLVLLERQPPIVAAALQDHGSCWACSSGISTLSGPWHLHALPLPLPTMASLWVSQQLCFFPLTSSVDWVMATCLLGVKEEVTHSPIQTSVLLFESSCCHLGRQTQAYQIFHFSRGAVLRTKGHHPGTALSTQ